MCWYIYTFMNLNRSYEGNKSGTIFVAEKLELKG